MATQTTQYIRVRHKGQLTLPADVREQLGIQEGDILRLDVENGRVIIENQVVRLRRALEASARYFADIPPLEPEELRRLASESIAESVAEKMARIEQDHRES